MAHSVQRNDVVQDDGTWYDPTPRSMISRERVIKFRDEALIEHILFMQLLEPQRTRPSSAEIADTWSSL